MKYKNIVFDWDGTLGMTHDIWLAGYREALEKQNHTFIDSAIAQYFFHDRENTALKYPDLDMEKLMEFTVAYVYSHLDELVLYDGVMHALAHFQSIGVQMTLVSSSPRKLLEKGIHACNVESCFLSIISGDDVMRHKPHPEAFNQSLDVIRGKPEETLIVGDAKNDVLAGKVAGTTTCLFLPQENELYYDFDELKTSDPDYIITKITDLIQIIES